MLSNPNNSPPNVGIPADDLACTASILQLLLGSSQGDTESRNALRSIDTTLSLQGPSLAPTAPDPQAVSSPAVPVDAPPIDIVQDELAPISTTTLVDHTPAEPMPATIVTQELDSSPALDLPTFDTLPDTPSSMSTSTSTIVPSHTPSPSLPGPLDPPSPLTPTISPNCLVSVPDTATPADPIMPTCQTPNTSESGLDHLPADSPLTGHMSLDFPLNNSAQYQAWVQALCTGSTPPALTPPCYPAKPIVEITQRPAHTSKHAHVKSPSPSPTPPPSTSGASSSNSAPTPSTSSSPPSLPSLSNTEMLVVLHEALCAVTEVLDQASKGHIASKKALGKRKSHN
ncbi:hypothetical protein BKA82DRAFT_33694 [Pisolithus tinctorius]|uniref:Uncharacterized protein n=1 Tax=Pisolithus tinctorius Marx 270 TaxID=870435 RepID=A0A0C3IG83_PISTI|nr:hypothetical protein BKA82DRAFT_33694 [Pisolithus tinctorius]KIN96037.1 hypothetical protein M404DRAFT_33694 [Pisolithus tinctorius Marx 270]